jgi:copper(I)-binding protein
MKRRIAGAVILAAVCGSAMAQPSQGASVRIEQAWSRATPKGATIAAGYMKVINAGTRPDRLIGGSASFAGAVEVHEMAMDGGVMKMRQLSGGLEIKPGETVEFKPGSYHVMFTGLKRPLARGDHVSVTFNFEKAGAVSTEYVVQSIGASGPEETAPIPSGSR